MNISFLEKRQKETLKLINKFGIRFAQKYDFEKVKFFFKNLNEKEKKQAAEEKAKLTEQKLK